MATRPPPTSLKPYVFIPFRPKYDRVFKEESELHAFSLSLIGPLKARCLASDLACLRKSPSSREDHPFLTACSFSVRMHSSTPPGRSVTIPITRVSSRPE